MLGGYLRSALAATIFFATPARAARTPHPAPAEISPAALDVLERLSRSYERAALVMSLWAARPGQQCAVGARYALYEDVAEPVQTLAPAAKENSRAHARALQQRLALELGARTAPMTPELAPIPLPIRTRRAA